MDEAPLLLMTHVARRFGAVRAVEDASLAVLRGATVGLVGESGCGKSTLARLATGLIAPGSGEIMYDGAPMRSRGGVSGSLFRKGPSPHRIAMVFQDAVGSLDPRWSVGRSIAEPVAGFGLRTGTVGQRDRVLQMMAAVGLPEDLIDRRPHELSLGQVQRAAVARALAGEPELLVCDEATSALDLSVQAQVLNALRTAQERTRLAMLFISHDVGVVRHMADLVAVMLRGRIVEFGLADDVFGEPRHPYTRRLLGAEPAAPSAGPGPVEAVAPGLCAFAPRCPVARPECRTVPAPLVDVAGVAVACHAAAAAD